MLDLTDKYQKKINESLRLYAIAHEPVKENWFNEILIKLRIKKRKYKEQKYDWGGVQEFKINQEEKVGEMNV